MIEICFSIASQTIQFFKSKTNSLQLQRCKLQRGWNYEILIDCITLTRETVRHGACNMPLMQNPQDISAYAIAFLRWMLNCARNWEWKQKNLERVINDIIWIYFILCNILRQANNCEGICSYGASFGRKKVIKKQIRWNEKNKPLCQRRGKEFCFFGICYSKISKNCLIDNNMKFFGITWL